MNTNNELKEAIDQLEVAIDAWIDKAATLKQERDEAREECEFTSRLAETMTKQRDTLAVALSEIREIQPAPYGDHWSCSHALDVDEVREVCDKALASLELPSGNNNAPSHDNTDNVTEQEPPVPDK